MNPYHEAEEARRKYQEAIAQGSIRMGKTANEQTAEMAPHYNKRKAQQHWDRAWDLYREAWFVLNITKYVERYREKDGLKDLKKARHYLDKLIEKEEEELRLQQQMCPHGVLTSKFCNRCMVESHPGANEQPKVPGALLEGKPCPHGMPAYKVCHACVEEAAKKTADSEGHTPKPR